MIQINNFVGIVGAGVCVLAWVCSGQWLNCHEICHQPNKQINTHTHTHTPAQNLI